MAEVPILDFPAAANATAADPIATIQGGFQRRITPAQISALHEAKPDPHPQYEQRGDSVVLFGSGDTIVALDVAPTIITGFTDSIVYGTADPGQADPVGGLISIENPGIYDVDVYVHGQIAVLGVKEEEIALVLASDGPLGNGVLWVDEVATDKVDDRCFTGHLTRRVIGGLPFNLWLELNATTSFGAFLLIDLNFEVHQVG